jgi:uncharacterized damage-inducible protein DinB
MDALDLLRDQVALADGLMDEVLAPVTAEQAGWRSEGSTANPIGQTLVHVYLSQDRLIHRLQDQPSLFESAGWQRRLGFDPQAPWFSQPVPDLAVSRAYAVEVRAATEQFLAQVQPEVLAREIQIPRGPGTGLGALSLLLVTHKMIHLGEISALLGSQGVTGFPF